MNRKTFIKLGSSAGISCLFPSSNLLDQEQFSIKRITSNNNGAFHWFGYYDKLQFDPTGRYVLGMKVDFEHRSPNENDSLRIGVIDLKNNNEWKEIGTTYAWGWQQGCMLQWVPESNSNVIWNDRVGRQFVSHILNTKTGKKRSLSKAIYALSPNGKWAIGTEFSRIQNLRPGYGYAGVPDPHDNIKAPSQIGLYKMDLETGHNKMLFSLADIAAIPHNGESVEDNWHWFNHLLVSPDSKRLLFLHRWRNKKEDRQKMAVGGFTTRMFTCNVDGSDLFCLDPSGNSSHFIWRDEAHICIFTKPDGHPWGFYLFEDKTRKIERIGESKMKENGHQTYLPKGRMHWIVNDNYATAKNRFQTPYLYHIPSDQRFDLGHYYTPPEYTGEWRCDLHPRYSPDGRMIIIDSTHEGIGRQMYLIDISKILKRYL